jgi:hypothetical protein
MVYEHNPAAGLVHFMSITFSCFSLYTGRGRRALVTVRARYVTRVDGEVTRNETAETLSLRWTT